LREFFDKQQHIILIYCVNFLTSNNILYWYIASFLKNEATTCYIDILHEFFDTYNTFAALYQWNKLIFLYSLDFSTCPGFWKRVNYIYGAWSCSKHETVLCSLRQIVNSRFSVRIYHPYESYRWYWGLSWGACRMRSMMQLFRSTTWWKGSHETKIYSLRMVNNFVHPYICMRQYWTCMDGRWPKVARLWKKD
jgi:hypothetical protein